MARLVPGPGEELSQFLSRALETRNLSVNGLARKLDPEKREHWQRAIRRWRSKGVSLGTANAARLGRTLNADFSSFTTRRQSVKPDRVTALEAEVANLHRRIEALEARDDPLPVPRALSA